MKTISVKDLDGNKAEWVNGALTLVDEQPKDITERIKTFEDACEWCYKNGKEYLVSNYKEFAITYSASDIAAADILAYLKLRIITCALNEGWKPTFKEGEDRYIPNLYAFCDEYTPPFSLTLGIYGDSSAKLCFKDEKLARYATNQFKDIYIDFSYKGKE